MTYNLGQAVTLTTSATDSNGAPVTPTLVLTLTKPDGTTVTPTVIAGSATFTVDQVNTWWWRWDASGAILDNDRGQFDVGDPKAQTYATLAEFKNRLKIADTVDDAELSDALEAASRDVEDDTGRPQFYLDQTATARIFNPDSRVVDTSEGQKLLIDDIGSTTGLIVEIGSGTDWTALTTYSYGPDTAFARGWPLTWLLRPFMPWIYFPTVRIRVTAQWGWPRIPPQIKQATLIRAQRLYRRKDSPEGVAGFNDMGVVRIGRYDPDYDKLIGRFVQDGFGGG